MHVYVCVCECGLVKAREREKARGENTLRNGLRQMILDGTVFAFLSLRGSVIELTLIYSTLITMLIRNTKYCVHTTKEDGVVLKTNSKQLKLPC